VLDDAAGSLTAHLGSSTARCSRSMRAARRSPRCTAARRSAGRFCRGCRAPWSMRWRRGAGRSRSTRSRATRSTATRRRSRARGRGTSLLVPLYSGTRCHAILALGPALGAVVRRGRARARLGEFASQASIAVENAELHDRLVERAALERDVWLARRIQDRLCPRRRRCCPPSTSPRRRRRRRRSAATPTTSCPLGRRTLGVALADVCGKGLPARCSWRRRRRTCAAARARAVLAGRAAGPAQRGTWSRSTSPRSSSAWPSPASMRGAAR
jgi:hypothetical protein